MALSQAEVAYLLGVGSGAKVCRHERFVRVRELETLLAYEAIYQRTLPELFAGVYEKVTKEIAARAQKLLAEMGQEPTTKRSARKFEALKNLATLNPKTL